MGPRIVCGGSVVPTCRKTSPAAGLWMGETGTVRRTRVTVTGATVVGMKRAFPVLAVVAVLVVTVVWHRLQSDSAPISRGTVSRVVDGDTIYVSSGGRSQDVRLIGIDTPETVDPDRPVGCYGPQASAFMKHWLTGRSVKLVYDRETHDKYGRFLAYVYVDGRRPVSVEQRLLRLGYARTLAIPPNTAHAAEYASIERAAAVAGRGLWSACS